jgi:hypothetical protein
MADSEDQDDLTVFPGGLVELLAGLASAFFVFTGMVTGDRLFATATTEASIPVIDAEALLESERAIVEF